MGENGGPHGLLTMSYVRSLNERDGCHVGGVFPLTIYVYGEREYVAWVTMLRGSYNFM